MCFGEEGGFCGIRRDCREPWKRGRNAKMERTELIGRPAFLIPSPERVNKPQDDHTPYPKISEPMSRPIMLA